MAVRDGVRASMPSLLGSMPEEWFENITETRDQAIIQRDVSSQ